MRVPTLELAPLLAEPSLSELMPPCALPSLLLALLLLLPLDASLAMSYCSKRVWAYRRSDSVAQATPRYHQSQDLLLHRYHELPDESDPPESLTGGVSLDPGAPDGSPPVGSLAVLGEPPPPEPPPIGGPLEPLGLDDPPDEPPDELELELELD